jgi:DNA repair ATPase RecN
MLHSVSRTGRDGVTESLHFRSGVNVIVGEPNTGKTRWLEIIDFVMGDDGTAEEKLGEVIFTKYASAAIELQVGDRNFTVQRRWHDAGVKTKVFVDEDSLNVQEFRQLMLDELGIPSLHYPQGNPYGLRTWPELGFRSLVRHWYRRQRFWGDLVDQQITSEQHACILQFLGIAERLYSQEYGDLVKAQKLIAELEAKRDSFQSTLNEISREIISEDELGVAVTPDAITQATARLDAEINTLNQKRDELVESAISAASPQDDESAKDAISKMTEEFAGLKQLEQKHAVELERVNGRLHELNNFQNRVGSEINRLERAIRAGDIMVNLKATHCPVCDQPIKQPDNDDRIQCFLCHQPLQINGAFASEPLKRLEFELDQLKGEKKEISELIESLSGRKRDYSASIRDTRNRCARLAEMLKPVRIATAAIIPPDVAEIEMEIGRRIERVDQLRRIRDALARRETIAAEILKIQSQVADLKAEVERQTGGLDFESASDVISDGMNEYVRQLKFDGKAMWTQRDIQFSVRKDSFSVRVGRQKWSSQLGGTMTIYFFLAYHYALLTLSASAESRVPPFLIVDFPPEIEGEKVADHENFVIEPFVALCKREKYKHVQIIAAGSAFKGLQGVHRQTLSEVWN